MKLHQFGIVFLIIALSFFCICDVKTNTIKGVLQERAHLNQYLETATDKAADSFVESNVERNFTVSKEEAVESFFLSLFTSLNVMDDIPAQEKIRMYVPIILVTDQDGYYIFYSDEYFVNGVSTIAKRWSEKYPYHYEDGAFVYNFTFGDEITVYDKNHMVTKEDNPVRTIDYHEIQTDDSYIEFRNKYPQSFLLQEENFYLTKKQAMISDITDKMTYYINKHNRLASQLGIAYHFVLPLVDNSELVRSIETPSIVAMFQGYPLKTNGEIYNRLAISAARIRKKDVYYVEEKGWYKVYHIGSCRECATNPKVQLEEPFDTIEECASKGAYACQICCPEEVHVPNYKRGT